MLQARRPPRVVRAGLGLVAVLVVCAAAGILAIAEVRAASDSPAAAEASKPLSQPAAVPAPRSAGAVDDRSPTHAESRGRDDVFRPQRSVLHAPLLEHGSDRWLRRMVPGDGRHHPGFGGLRRSRRRGPRFSPQGPAGVIRVVSRVSLSPKHSVYLLRVGRRVLLVGAGPQGAPSLISELDDLPRSSRILVKEKRHEPSYARARWRSRTTLVLAGALVALSAVVVSDHAARAGAEEPPYLEVNATASAKVGDDRAPSPAPNASSETILLNRPPDPETGGSVARIAASIAGTRCGPCKPWRCSA